MLGFTVYNVMGTGTRVVESCSIGLECHGTGRRR